MGKELRMGAATACVSGYCLSQCFIYNMFPGWMRLGNITYYVPFLEILNSL